MSHRTRLTDTADTLQLNYTRSSPMRRIGLASLMALVLAISELPGAIAAPPPSPLKLSIKQITPLARSQAPQSLLVEIGCNSPELFQGRLELKIMLEKRLVHDFLSHDLAITAGGLRFRITLPPLVVHGAKAELKAYGRFIMEKQVIDLGPDSHLVSFPAAWKRSFVAAVVHPQEMIVAPGKRGAPEWINLEQFNPFSHLTFDPQSGAQFDLLTHAPRLAPEDLPSSALGYAIFDLLFIEGEGFARLNSKQLAAIGDWTEAGGSIVVAPSGKMSADHVDFLNRIAVVNTQGEGGPHKNPAAYTLSEEGLLVVGERNGPSAKLAYDHCGLGRTLVIHERLDPDNDFDTPEWKAAVAFLWKIRVAQREQILQQGEWNFPAPQIHGRPAIFRPYKPQRDDLPRSIREFLLPERIEGVPLWVVVIILSLYLVIIAPGDYFLLGRLNSRKYTWVFFALMSAAFTGCTVMIAESYMGHADCRTTLIFADLAANENNSQENIADNSGSRSGQVLAAQADSDRKPKLARVSRFEMLFTATQQQIEIPARNELYVDITDRALMPSASHKDRHSFVFADDGETDVIEAVAADLPVYAGLMPGSFTIEQQMRQWSPRVNRRTSFGDDPDLVAESAIDWQALHPEEWATPEGRELLREAVLLKEPAARILLFHEALCFDLNMDAARTQALAKRLSDQRIVALVQSASVRPASGLFTAVSQISPTGGENLEDLTLLDNSDPGQWLLAVVIQRDNNWLVFRKLYRGRQP